MNVCIVYDGDYPWDVRIEKMSATLAANGYQVHLVCRNLSKQPLYEFSNNIHIHRLPVLASDRTNEWCSFPAFFNPVWLNQLRRVVQAHSIGLIIVRDLPLALAAILMGRIYKLPVILDMAENYPAMLRDIWKYEEFKFLNVFVRNPIVAKAIELLALKTAMHVLVVIEESKNRLVHMGVAQSSISIVRNTPACASRNDSEIRSAGPRKDTSNPVRNLNLIYVGGLEPVRGLEALIQTVPQLIEQVQQLRLTIVGGGKWQSRLQAEVDQIGASRYVTLTGRLPYSEAVKRVEQSDAGIIPHHITAHTGSTVPNKLFEYMANGIPVIATDMPPVRRIIEETDCGYIYSNVSELITALRNLANLNNRKRLGNNALQASRTRYNWELDGAILLRIVQSAMRRLPPKGLVADSIAR